MRIIATLKQVPKNTRIEMKAGEFFTPREGIETIMNFDDGNALEILLEHKDKDPEGTDITTLSVGPVSAEEILRESLALGVDRAILVSDMRMRGSDSRSTAKVLAAAITKTGEFDAIMMGCASQEGRTSHVPAMVAELLSLPLITNVSDFHKEGEKLIVIRDMGSLLETVEAMIPCVLSNPKKRYSLRGMSIAGIRRAMSEELPVMTLEDIGADPEQVGYNAAKTNVVSIESVVKERKRNLMYFKDYKDGDFGEIKREVQKIK